MKFDSLASLDLYETLEQTVDFKIDPEPLNDALNFIAQRYQIKVTIDAIAVRQGLIDPTIEVEITTPGLKLRQLLELLLKQSKRPLAFEVRNGALVFIPVSPKQAVKAR